MKIKKIIFILTSICFIVNYQLEAQSAGSNQALLEGGGVSIVTFDERDKAAVGSPYIYKDFAPANISVKPNEIFKVRYNAYSDEIEIKISEDKIQNLNKNISDITISFIKDDVKFTPINYISNDDGVKRGYFISHTNTNKDVKLYTRKEIKYIKAKPALTSYDNDKPAEFKPVSDVYYITINDAYARELPTRKKDISKLFPKQSKEILNFIKSNKIKLSEQEDLITLVNYINTL